jgi:hypothetical protein
MSGIKVCFVTLIVFDLFLEKDSQLRVFERKEGLIIDLERLSSSSLFLSPEGTRYRIRRVPYYPVSRCNCAHTEDKQCIMRNHDKVLAQFD